MSAPSRRSGKPPESPISPANTSGPETRIALRPIAPKAPDPWNRPFIDRSQSTHSGPSTSKRRRLLPRCYVCFKVNCRLVSHKLYAGTPQRLMSAKASSEVNLNIQEDAAFTASYAYKLAQIYVHPNIASSKVDPFYDLPVPPEFNSREMHHLFYELFRFEAINLLSITPPQEVVADFLLSPFMAPALVDTALCLSILALAAAVMAPREGTISKNVRTLTLMGKTMEKMRERLDSDPGLIADTTIAAASILWSVNWYLNDAEALRQHRASVSSLIKRRGGLHKLGMSEKLARYITWADICVGLTLREQCHFPKPKGLSLRIHPPPKRYGQFWDLFDTTAEPTLDPLVVKGCQDTARLIEILEQMKEDSVSGTTYYYVIHTLSTIMNENSAFHASYNESGTLNECVALALYLVKIKIFSFYQAQAPYLMDQHGNRLVQAIKETGRPSHWQQYHDLLNWMLFTLLLIEENFEHKGWCLEALSHTTKSEFGEIDEWPPDWKEELRRRLFQFVWCDVRFSSLFNIICISIWTSQIEDSQDSNDDD